MSKSTAGRTGNPALRPAPAATFAMRPKIRLRARRNDLATSPSSANRHSVLSLDGLFVLRYPPRFLAIAAKQRYVG